MPIESTTVYTKERILKFNRFVAMSKKWMWVFMTVCNIIILFGVVLMILLGDFEKIIFLLGIMAVSDFILIFNNFIIPRIAVKKQIGLHANIKFSLNEHNIHIQASTVNGIEDCTYNYPMIVKAAAQDNELYLFISKSRAFIVDMSLLADEHKALLKGLLEDKLGAKKVKWK